MITFSIGRWCIKGAHLQSNWSDLWGPTFTCPTLTHVGELGDGGKWVCGVNQMLQRYARVPNALADILTCSSEQGRLIQPR
jgi:hypothetical protein